MSAWEPPGVGGARMLEVSGGPLPHRHPDRVTGAVPVLTWRLVLLVLAVFAFVLAAFIRPRWDVDWTPLGFAFVAASLIVEGGP